MDLEDCQHQFLFTQLVVKSLRIFLMSQTCTVLYERIGYRITSKWEGVSATDIPAYNLSGSHCWLSR